MNKRCKCSGKKALMRSNGIESGQGWSIFVREGWGSKGFLVYDGF